MLEGITVCGANLPGHARPTLPPLGEAVRLRAGKTLQLQSPTKDEKPTCGLEAAATSFDPRHSR
jgi:hypothetical protein